MTDEVKGAGQPEVSEETLKVLQAIKEDGEVFEGVDLPENKETPTEEAEDEAKPELEAESEKPEEEAKPLKRESKFVPVSKFNEMRKENQEYKKKLLELDEQLKVAIAKPKDIEEEILLKSREFSEKYGFDVDQAKDLFKTVAEIADKKSSKLDLEGKVARYEAERKRLEDDRKFEKEFSGISQSYPELDSVKDDFKRLSFTEGYEKTPLPVLAAWYVKEFKPKKTAESASKGKFKGVIDFENLSEEELKGLPEKEFLKYMAYQNQKHGLV